MRFDLVTKASPDQVLRALTDFSKARLTTWRTTLDPKTYELRESGPTWAVARESSPRSPFWVVPRYDWSSANEVRWTIVESSYGGGGEGRVRIELAAGGGSQVHAEWTYTGARLLHRPALFVINRVMPRVIKRMWVSVLDQYAANEQA